MCDLLDPLFENTKQEIFGELINQCKPPPKKREPSLSGMKKADLVEECKRLNLESSGTIPDLKLRIKNARVPREESLEDLFKKYEQESIK